MSKICAIVVFCFVSIFQSDAFSAQIVPGVAKTRDIVRLSLWYEGIQKESARGESISKSEKIHLSDGLKSALFRQSK